MGKRIVVLGGAGLIGTHLCRQLLADGNEVFCVDIRDAADSPLLADVRSHDAFRYVQHNIAHGFAIRCDEIYNLAAPSRLRYDRILPVETLRMNVQGTVNTLEAARNERARVVYGSSSCVYGSRGREPSAEEHLRNTGRYMLAEAKRAAEAFHRAYRAEYGVDSRIARIFNTYGPGADLDDQRVAMKMIVAALRNRDLTIYGSGEQTRTFCWVGDVADGLVRLMRTAPSEQVRTVDLGSEHEISLRALAEKIIDLTASKSRIVHTQARTDDPRRRMPDLTAARRELDWSPGTPLLEGLKRTVEYAEKELARTARTEMSWVEVNS